MICERTVRPVMERNRAALKIQSLWRRYDAMIELELQFMEQDGAVAIQTIWRGFRERALYARKVNSIIRIQAIARGRQARDQLILSIKATVSIQRIWRGFWAQLQTQLDFMDVITAQSIVRRKLALVESDARRRAIHVLQKNSRRFLAVQTVSQLKKERQEVIECTTAAVTCQVSMDCFVDDT